MVVAPQVMILKVDTHDFPPSFDAGEVQFPRR